MKNKHESSRAADIARDNTILLSQVGSGLHGVTVQGTDDRDEMGVCIEPRECVIGLENFEQYQFRTQAEGKRSGPGDLDLVIYSLRKWANLAAKGNPTVLLLLYAPPEQIVKIERPGAELQANPDLFLSKEAGQRFIGYLDSQKEQMLGLRGKHTNRPELVDIYGFDTKFAYHAIRLGIQGIELITTSKMTLPMPEPERTWLTNLRLGEYSKEEALERIIDLRAELAAAVDKADLPEKADYRILNRWLINTYEGWWARDNA